MSHNSKYTQKARFKVGAALTFANATDVDIVNDNVRVANHGLVNGQSLGLKVSSGTITTGLTATTAYYAIVVDASTFAFATSRANAFAGTKVNITAIPTGVMLVYPNGNGITLSDIIIPANHMIVNAHYAVIVQAAATATTGTLAISVEGANDIVSAAAISTNVWDLTSPVTEVATIPIFATMNTHILTTADRQVTFTTGTSPWNAGVVDVWFDIVPTLA